MRLLHLSPAYAPFHGGAEILAQQISERFARAGHEVTVVTTQAERPHDFWEGAPPRRSQCETLNGVTVVRLPLRAWPPAPWTFHVAHRLAQAASNWPGDLSLWLAGKLPRIAGLCATLQQLPACDAIHAVNMHFPALAVAAWREARRRNVPLLVTPFLHANGSRIYPRTVLREAAVVMAQSQVEVEALQRVGIALERIRITGVGIDLKAVRGGNGARFRRAYHIGDEPLVAFVGTASLDKGALDVYHAMQRIWQRGVNARMVFAGSLMPAVAPVVQADERCCCLGVVSDEVKRDLLAAATLLAMPSRVESLGLAYLEAWANGLPVIGARVGATAELIAHGVNGLLVPFGDDDALAAAMQSLLADGVTCRRLGDQGRELVESLYTWTQVFPRIADAYEQAVSQRHSST